MSWEKFEKLNSTIKFFKGNIDFNKAIAHDILIIAFSLPIGNMHILKSFFKSIHFERIIKDFETHRTIFTCFVNRADHINFVTSCKSNILDSVLIQSNTISPKLNINPLHILLSLWQVLKLRHLKISLKSKIYLASQLCYNLNIEKDLRMILLKNKQAIKTKNYVALISSFGLENLLCQVINTYTKINTYTLSHGVSYVDYKLNRPLDYINGYNISAQYVFVWGKSSKIDLTNNYNFPSNRIIIGGNPKYLAKEINLKTIFNNCIVLLPRKIYDESNLSLLRLISKCQKNYSFEVFLKLHPSLDFQKYEIIANQYGFKICPGKNTLAQELSSDIYDFAIAYNTTAYYESMYYNLPCLRYAENENEMYYGLNDKFSTSYELQKLIIDFKNMNHKLLNQEVTILLHEILGVGINTYAKYLNSNFPLSDSE